MISKPMPEKSPNETLADLVADKLREKGSIPDGKVNEVAAKLAAGTANQDDWRLWIELARTKQQKDGNDGTH